MGGCPRVKSTSLCLLEMYTVCFTHLVYNNICFLLTKNNTFLSLQVKNGGFHKNLFRKKTKIASNHTVQDNCSTIALRSFQSSSSVCVYLNNKNHSSYAFCIASHFVFDLRLSFEKNFFIISIVKCYFKMGYNNPSKSYGNIIQGFHYLLWDF